MIVSERKSKTEGVFADTGCQLDFSAISILVFCDSYAQIYPLVFNSNVTYVLLLLKTCLDRAKR